MTARVLVLLDREGIDARVACEDAGLAYDDLANPHARIAYAVNDRLIERAAAALGASVLGAKLAAIVDEQAYGAAGLALATAPSFAEGLARAFGYQRLWGDGDRARRARAGDELDADGERFTLRTRARELCVSFRHPGPSPLARAVLAEVAMIEVAWAARLLVGAHAVPRAVRFVHPAWPEPYARLVEALGVEPCFASPANELTFDAAIGEAKVVIPREVLAQIVAREAERALAALPTATSFAARVRAVVGELGLGAPLASTARRLRASPRTLQRRLTAEGTSYAALVDALRREAAARLDDRGASEKEITHTLGYADPSALRRARARWRRA